MWIVLVIIIFSGRRNKVKVFFEKLAMFFAGRKQGMFIFLLVGSKSLPQNSSAEKLLRCAVPERTCDGTDKLDLH